MTSKDPKKRWESKYGKNKRFNDDIQKYGWNNIKHEVLFSGLGKSRGKNNPSSKEVCQYSLNDELIKIFESTGEAERITGISHQQISNCCNGKQKTCHGYIWKYKTA